MSTDPVWDDLVETLREMYDKMGESDQSRKPINKIKTEFFVDGYTVVQRDIYDGPIYRIIDRETEIGVDTDEAPVGHFESKDLALEIADYLNIRESQANGAIFPMYIESVTDLKDAASVYLGLNVT